MMWVFCMTVGMVAPETGADDRVIVFEKFAKMEMVAPKWGWNMQWNDRALLSCAAHPP